MKNGLQRFGKFLSAMVMPNIGAFIAWGFITALFIADGWLPNERLASIQPYMLYYLIPVLIAGQGGYMVGGDRGRVMGAIAVMGTIAGVGGTEGQPMLLGAMVMGPLAGWCIKKFDQFMETRMPMVSIPMTVEAAIASPGSEPAMVSANRMHTIRMRGCLPNLAVIAPMMVSIVPRRMEISANRLPEMDRAMIHARRLRPSNQAAIQVSGL